MYPFLIKIIAAIWGVFILLMFFMPPKRRAFIKEEKGLFVMIPVLLLLTAAWFTFFEDAEFRFVCRKDIQRCDCYRSTFFNKELRITDSYALEGITGADVNSHLRWRGKHSKKTAYTVEFSGLGKDFEMPKDFRSRSEAQKQVKLVNNFLHTDISEYVYTETSDPVEGMMLFFMFILGGTGIMACFILLSKKTETKEEEEKEE